VIVAQDSIGLRLPERLLRGVDDQRPTAARIDALEEFVARADPPADALVVADRCLGVLVPYAVRRPTLVSAEEWQAGYSSFVDDAREATTIVEGGTKGRRLAAERGVDYILVAPGCYPDAVETLGGRVVYESNEVVAIRV
jgi:hypothetical protein